MVSEVGTHGNDLVGKPQQPGFIHNLLSQLLPQGRKLGQGLVQMSLEAGPQVEGENVLMRLVEAGKEDLEEKTTRTRIPEGLRNWAVKQVQHLLKRQHDVLGQVQQLVDKFRDKSMIKELVLRRSFHHLERL